MSSISLPAGSRNISSVLFMLSVETENKQSFNEKLSSLHIAYRMNKANETEESEKK